MSQMFQGANTFNQNIGTWTTDNVTNMASMFDDASAFNQDLSGWAPGCDTNSPIDEKPFNFRAGANSWTESGPQWDSACN
jgi:hypothetical protein